jgi:hypothetical protein
MDNAQIIKFFSNLPYELIGIILLALFILCLLIKLIKKINFSAIKKEKVRSILIVIEFLVVFLFIYVFYKIKVDDDIVLSLVTFTITIFEVLNFNIIFTYLLEKSTNFLSKLYYFFISIIVALIPSIIFTLIIYEISILLL